MNNRQEVVDVKALGEAIVARRDLNPRGKAALSLRAVAEQAGVSISTLSRVERGDAPDLSTYVKVCRWLDVPLDKFVIQERTA